MVIVQYLAIIQLVSVIAYLIRILESGPLSMAFQDIGQQKQLRVPIVFISCLKQEIEASSG